MALFISYSSQDRLRVDALTTAFRRGQQQVWFDQELGGGDSWWNTILEQIRSCEVFIVALSNNWAQSKPSQSELRYAKALNRPILPVRIGAVDSMRVNPLAALQIIDYREPTVDAGIQLVTAVHALVAKPVPLPDPLPEEPPVPFGYISRLGNTLVEKELSPQQQIQVLVELKSGLAEDGDDPSARSDIGQLLRMLRLRHDVTYRTRNEIDQLLAEIGAAEPDSAPGASATSDSEVRSNASMTPTQSSTAGQPVRGSEPSRPAVATTIDAGPSKDAATNRRLIIIGGAALAVIVAIVAVVVLINLGSGPKESSAGTRTAAPVAGAPAAPGQAAPAPGTTAGLASVLLGPPDVSTIMGTPSMNIANQTQQMRPDWKLSNPDCLGAFDAIQNGVYAGSGYTGVSGQELITADNNYRVSEAAVSFPTADKAQAFVATQADKWRACAGQPVTLSTPSGTSHWTFGDFTGAAPRITEVRTRKDGSTCQRVLSAASDIVLDVRACAPGIQNQGGQIADAMAAKVKG
jgi:serine/threonine kinase PknH